MTCRRFRCEAQLGVEPDVLTTMTLPVIEGTGKDGRAQHLLQRDRLGAELHGVSRFVPEDAALVLYGKRAPPTGDSGQDYADVRGGVPDAMELYDVRDTRQTETKRAQPEAAGDPRFAAHLARSLVNPRVNVPPVNGSAVFDPLAFDVYEGETSRAVDHVLQPRKRQEFVLIEHSTLSQSIRIPEPSDGSPHLIVGAPPCPDVANPTSTPAGTRLLWNVTT